MTPRFDFENILMNINNGKELGQNLGRDRDCILQSYSKSRKQNALTF